MRRHTAHMRQHLFELAFGPMHRKVGDLQLDGDHEAESGVQHGRQCHSSIVRNTRHRPLLFTFPVPIN